MDSEPVILESAHRHGVSEGDMLHTYKNALFATDVGEGVTIYVGPAAPGHPFLEIGVAAWYGELTIVHAMPARAKFLR